MREPIPTDNIDARRYSMWERLGKLFRIEPQVPGAGGKFRLSTIVTPTVDLVSLMTDKGYFSQTIPYTAAAGALMISTIIPLEEVWNVFNISWIRRSGDNLVSDLRIAGQTDTGTATDSILVEPGVNVSNIFVSFGGGFLMPGGTSFQSQLQGIGPAAGNYEVTVRHQKLLLTQVI